MPEPGNIAENFHKSPDRRAHPRQQVRALSYVDLGEGNGGIVLNLSEGGLALQAVTRLMDDQIPNLRFQISDSRNWLETSARITWKSASRKVVGIKFLNLSDTGKGQIREWIESEHAPSELSKLAISEFESERSSSITVEDSLLLMPEAVADTLEAVKNQEKPSGEINPSKSITIFPDSPVRLFTGPSAEAALPKAAAVELTESAVPPAETTSRRVQMVSALFGFLAVLSLIIGWAAGRTGFAHFSKSKDERVVAHPTAGAVAPHAAASQIEIQDIANHTRSIPFFGPVTSANTAQYGSGTRTQADAKESQASVSALQLHSGNAGIGTSSPKDAAGRLSGGSAPADASSNDQNGNEGAESRDSAAGSSATDSSARKSARVGVLERGHVIHKVDPLYPETAMANRIEGTVKLHAVIGIDGSVKSLESVSGPDALIDTAMNAVRQWRYTPTLLDGKPIETDQDIFIVFRLPADNQ